MKKLLMTSLSLFFATVMMAQRDVATFKTNGYSTKDRIEKAAKAVDGVKSAEYSKSDKQVKVVYDKKRTSPQKIRKAVMAIDQAPAGKAKKKRSCGQTQSHAPKVRMSEFIR